MSDLPPPPGPSAGDPGAVAVPPDAPVDATADEVAEAPGLDDRERTLAPAAITSWRISAALSLIMPVAVTTTLGFVFVDHWGWAIFGGWLVLAAWLIGWLQPARYRRWRWQLTDQAVDLRHGVLIHQQETVPYFRIQQIDIVQGPLDRLLHLANLQVTTASASGSATLPGIPEDDAPQVRVELLARATQAVADHTGDLRDAV